MKKMVYKNRQEIHASNSVQIASPVKRTIAIVVDFSIIAVLFIVLLIIFQLVIPGTIGVKVRGLAHIDIEGSNMSNHLKLFVNAVFACLPSVYFTLTTYFFKGQTIGKKLLRIKVISLYHEQIGLWHCIERSLGYIASTLEFGLGFIQVFWNPNKMTLHDKIAETIVVNCKKTEEQQQYPQDNSPDSFPEERDMELEKAQSGNS